MTRINVVPVSELCDQHLLAEHRELTRIPNGLLSGKLKVQYEDRPSEYTLGAGHVKFFTNKIGWLHDRYIQLTNECKSRNFYVKNIWPENDNLSYDSYVETEKALQINRERIRIRWPKNARYYGKPFNFKEKLC
jgi:hypothetical protein